MSKKIVKRGNGNILVQLPSLQIELSGPIVNAFRSVPEQFIDVQATSIENISLVAKISTKDNPGQKL